MSRGTECLLNPAQTRGEILLLLVQSYQLQVSSQVQLQDAAQHRTRTGTEIKDPGIGEAAQTVGKSSTERSVQAERATYTIFYQAEDRELAKIEPVLYAMTISFLGSIKKLDYWED